MCVVPRLINLLKIYAKKRNHVKIDTVIVRVVHSMEGTGVLLSNTC